MWRGMNESTAKDADEAVRVAMNFLKKQAGTRDRRGVCEERVNLTAVSSDSLPPILPDHWQTVRSAPASGAVNMALDNALFETARARGTGVWRTYAWATPTISFGRNEATRGAFDAMSIDAAGLDAVRRPTGGRALLHADEVTYSVTVPINERTAWSAVYAAVNAILLRAIRSLGVDAVLVERTNAPSIRPDGPVCFDRPAMGEIAVGGAKLVGSAVWRDGGAFLQHGSILLRDRQPLLLDAMRPSQLAVRTASEVTLPSAASLDACLVPPPSWHAVANALEAALRVEVTSRGGAVVDDSEPLVDPSILDRHTMHYTDPSWLWRR